MHSYYFDLDGTLFDTRELTIAAYTEASDGAYDPSFYGLPAQAWACPTSVHFRKAKLFAEGVPSVRLAWAHALAAHLLSRGIPYQILTGASTGTVTALTAHPMGHLISKAASVRTGLTPEAKRAILADAPGDVVHYLDDLADCGRTATAGLRRVVLHCPEIAPAGVVLAAGLASRFGGRDKSAIRWKGTSLVDRLLFQIHASTEEPPVLVYGKQRPFVHGARVVPVAHLQNGPAASAALALGQLAPDAPVVFVDCDVVLPDTWMEDVVRDATIFGCAVAVADHTVEPGRYGRIIPCDGFVSDVVEGSTSSGRVLAGAYAFATAGYFQQLFVDSWRTDREVRMADLIKRADVCRATHVGAGWVPMGSPEEVKYAQMKENEL